MKLRVAHIVGNTRLGGEYLIQIRRWAMWNDMYYNPKTKILQEEQAVLGDGLTKRAVFNDIDDARNIAVKFKNSTPERIRQTWEV